LTRSEKDDEEQMHVGPTGFEAGAAGMWEPVRAS